MSLLDKMASAFIGAGGGILPFSTWTTGVAATIVNIGINSSQQQMKSGSVVQIQVHINGVQIWQEAYTAPTDITSFSKSISPTYYGNPYPVPAGGQVMVHLHYLSQSVDYGTVSQVASLVLG
jgi:hypothetical protein